MRDQDDAPTRHKAQIVLNDEQEVGNDDVIGSINHDVMMGLGNIIEDFGMGDFEERQRMEEFESVQNEDTNEQHHGSTNIHNTYNDNKLTDLHITNDNSSKCSTNF